MIVAEIALSLVLLVMMVIGAIGSFWLLKSLVQMPKTYLRNGVLFIKVGSDIKREQVSSIDHLLIVTTYSSAEALGGWIVKKELFSIDVDGNRTLLWVRDPVGMLSRICDKWVRKLAQSVARPLESVEWFEDMDGRRLTKEQLDKETKESFLTGRYWWRWLK